MYSQWMDNYLFMNKKCLDLLVSGPLCYVKKTNTMVTVSGKGVLEAYM